MILTQQRGDVGTFSGWWGARALGSARREMKFLIERTAISPLNCPTVYRPGGLGVTQRPRPVFEDAETTSEQEATQ